LIRNLTPEEYESEKRRIIELMFNPYNSNNSDEYISHQQVAEDAIQNRIDWQMQRNNIVQGTKINEDVYQFTFENLLKINKKATKKFVDGYYKNPNSVYWFSFLILKRKGFAIHPDNPDNPNHSLSKNILFTSSFKKNSVEVSFNEDDENEDAGKSGYVDTGLILFDEDEDKFENKFDITVEQILDHLDEDERKMFLDVSVSQKGYLTRIMKEKKLQLFNKIKEIKNKMTEKEIYAKLLQMEDRLLFFNRYGEVILLQDDLEILRELYKIYFPQFSKLNTSCSSCIKDMLNVCISRYGHLKSKFEPDVSDEDIKPVGSITIGKDDEDDVNIPVELNISPEVEKIDKQPILVKKVSKSKKK
jgi:hypothetical protein